MTSGGPSTTLFPSISSPESPPPSNPILLLLPLPGARQPSKAAKPAAGTPQDSSSTTTPQVNVDQSNVDPWAADLAALQRQEGWLQGLSRLLLDSLYPGEGAGG
jgi:hypothetical protein